MKIYSVDPVDETQGEGNGWYPVEAREATSFEVYDMTDPREPVLLEALPTLKAAHDYVYALGAKELLV